MFAVLSQILTNIINMNNALLNILSIVITSYIFTVIAGVIVLLLNKKKVKLSILLLFPLFIFSWLPINIIVLFKKECKWEQIRHERVLTLEEIA